MPTRTSSHVKATIASATSGLQSFKPLKSICQSFCGLHLFP